MSIESFTWTVVLWTLFGLQHSLLAQRGVKDLCARWLGRNFVDYGYRFTYFVSQCLVFPAFWYLVSRLEPGVVLWRVPEVLYPLEHLLQVLSHFILLGAVVSADVNSFIGVKPLVAYVRARWRGTEPPAAHLFGDNTLVISRIFKIVRHPMYLGIILGLATSTGVFTEKVVLNLVCLIAYVQVGVYFEERQLLRVFGEAYRRYQQQVPKIVPGLRPGLFCKRHITPRANCEPAS